MSRWFVDLSNGPRNLMITLPRVGKYHQHYVRRLGWFTCLDRWHECPFCVHMNNRRFHRRTKYYFESVDLDQNPNIPQILLLDHYSGDTLIQTFVKKSVHELLPEIVGIPFTITRDKRQVIVEKLDRSVSHINLSSLVHYEWDHVCRPRPQEYIQKLIDGELAVEPKVG